MDKEYLDDYEQNEEKEFERFTKRMQEESFSFEKEKYPPERRYVKLQKPVAVCAGGVASRIDNIWAQVPFSGSLIFTLPPLPQDIYEEECGLKASEIPRLVDFVKETGRLQFALNAWPSSYEGLDFLDPIFEELRPPFVQGLPDYIFGQKEELEKARHVFLTLGKLGFIDSLRRECESAKIAPMAITELIAKFMTTFTVLKIGAQYEVVVEEIENQIVDDYKKAAISLTICRQFIVDPIRSVCSDLDNFAFEDIRGAGILPAIYRPQEIRFPVEIGKFLVRKLTRAPQGLRACNELIDEYDAYDLRNILESLNEAIVTNHLDVVYKNTKEFSEILDNIWNDSAIPRRVKNLRKGVPISIAAVGSAISAFTGSLEGFLAGLGFSVGAKFLEVNIEALSERLVKFFARSYQANIYDFKKKYKAKIT